MIDQTFRVSINTSNDGFKGFLWVCRYLMAGRCDDKTQEYINFVKNNVGSKFDGQI